MHIKFFVKNLVLFLIPMLIPMLILGTLSYHVTQKYVKSEAARNNTNLFSQIDRSIQLLFQEMDSLYLSFNRPETVYSLKEVLRTNLLTYEQNQLMNTLKNIINTPVNSRNYIESIYVYIENQNGYFITSYTEGLVRLGQYHDTSWYQTYQDQKYNPNVFTETRTIRRFHNEKPRAITTVYKTLSSITDNLPNGVIVLNIYSDYIDSLLADIEASSNQSIFIADAQNRIIFSSTRGLIDLVESSIADLEQNRPIPLSANGSSYSAFRYLSPENGWNYISLTPRDSQFSISSLLNNITILSLCLSVLLGFGFAYYMTRKNVNHIRAIISIIKSAEKGPNGSQLPVSARNDEYGFIINKFIQSFLEKQQLDLQLAEKKYMLRSTELMALQYQINPHFLFNTLETVYWKAVGILGHPNEVNAMLERLAKILKYSLDQANKVVTIEKEINYTRTYIEIMKVRYPGKFDVLWELDDDRIPAYNMIKLLLQPLVENSIYHGIKEKKAGGRIKIKMSLRSDSIRLAVIDNGIGMKQETLLWIRERMQDSSEPGEHVGLFNTHKRLRLAYGDRHGLKIRSKSGLGTCLEMSIPLHDIGGCDNDK